MWISARATVTWNGSGSPGRAMVMSTSLPGLPRRTDTAWSLFHPKVDSPATAMMRSPVSSPAASAGVPAMGAMIVIQPSRTSMRMPSPP